MGDDAKPGMCEIFYGKNAVCKCFNFAIELAQLLTIKLPVDR